MGGTFGKSAGNVPLPDFDLVGKGTNYEIRAYSPYVVAEVALDESGDDGQDDRFKTLAKVRWRMKTTDKRDVQEVEQY